ncbi:biliverdin-producing heme oxygenase [Luteimonas sp. MJ246]|uniref:biliverdin-producing heme oxygenase n=1 Tax=Luteimonas sp. MJ174 TaxID=3129237 RepID=UPI0031BB62EB
MAPRTDSPRAATLAALRNATRPAHLAIDGAFDGGLRSLDDYRRYLRSLLPLAHWLDVAWRDDWPPHLACWRDPGRAACIAADLRALGAPDAIDTPTAHASPEEWLGGCYVMEGSALGARLLARDVAALPRTPAEGPLPRGFLDRHLGDPGRWPRFRAAVGTLPPDGLPGALRGAAHGFALVAAALAREGRPA